MSRQESMINFYTWIFGGITLIVYWLIFNQIIGVTDLLIGKFGLKSTIDRLSNYYKKIEKKLVRLRKSFMRKLWRKKRKQKANKQKTDGTIIFFNVIITVSATLLLILAIVAYFIGDIESMYYWLVGAISFAGIGIAMHFLLWIIHITFKNITAKYLSIIVSIMLSAMLLFLYYLNQSNKNDFLKIITVISSASSNFAFIFMLVSSAENLDVFDMNNSATLASKYRVIILFFIVGIAVSTINIITLQQLGHSELIARNIGDEMNYSVGILNVIEHAVLEIFPGGSSKYILSEDFWGKFIHFLGLIYRFLITTVFITSIIRMPLPKKEIKSRNRVLRVSKRKR